MTNLARCAIAVAATVIFSGCSVSGDMKLAEKDVATFHQRLDAGQFDAIYTDASEELRQATPHEQFVAFLGEVHGKMGNTTSANETSWHVNFDSAGNRVALVYSTTFANGVSNEQFAYRMHDGKALLLGYRIDPANAAVPAPKAR